LSCGHGSWKRPLELKVPRAALPGVPVEASWVLEKAP